MLQSLLIVPFKIERIERMDQHKKRGYFGEVTSFIVKCILHKPDT